MSGSTSGLRRVLDAGLAAPLAPLGFVGSRDRRTWVRDTGELSHVVAVWKRRGSFTLQWGIVCPELVDVMWAMPYKPFDVAQSIVTGTASSIRHPAQMVTFSAAALETETGAADVAAGVREDVAVITGWMEPFGTRRVLRDYLLANREPTDRHALPDLNVDPARIVDDLDAGRDER